MKKNTTWNVASIVEKQRNGDQDLENRAAGVPEEAAREDEGGPEMTHVDADIALLNKLIVDMKDVGWDTGEFIRALVTTFKHLATDYTITKGRITKLRNIIETTAPGKGDEAKPVAWPKIMYVCKVCYDNYPEQCGKDRDYIAVTADGEWICDDCLQEDDYGPVTKAPLLYAAPPADNGKDAEIARLKEEIGRLHSLVDRHRGFRDEAEDEADVAIVRAMMAEALIRDLVAALKPFAQEADEYFDEASDDCFLTDSINLRDVRAARAAITRAREAGYGEAGE
jgi:hypothetical protein